jgi:VWFA-related protein
MRPPRQPRPARRRALAGSLLFALVALLAPLAPSGIPVFAQGDGGAGGTSDSGTSGSEPFFDVVNVEIVNIDVWVTDKQGEPVEGLQKEDFRVFRDGEPVEISNFYAVAEGHPASPVARETIEPLDTSAPPPTQLGEPQVPPEHRLWLVVYIDNYDIDPIERKRVFPALRAFLAETLGPGDRAMIVTYDRSLKVRRPFTDHLPALLDTLDEIKDESGHAVIRRRELMETFHLIDQADTPSEALLHARRYAEQVMNEVGYTVDALERLVDSLAGLPGRKALIHVSSGIPMLAGEPAFHAIGSRFEVSEPYAEIPRHDTSRSFERVNRHANAHRVVFYTLDAGGLRGMEFGKAEYGGFVNPSLRNTLDSVVPENLQAPLRLMALETGGRAIVNRNEVLPALEEASQDFRSFYSLGIASGDTDSARYHKVEVKLRDDLDRHGLRLRHRSGYRSKTPTTRMRESLRSALLYAHQSNPLGLEVEWGRPRPNGTSNTYELPIRLRLPLRNLVLVPLGNGKHELRLRLFVGAVGKDGATSEIEDTPLGLRIADENVEAARGESFLHTHKILLGPGRQKVGVALLDVFGNQSSIVTGFVDVGRANP